MDRVHGFSSWVHGILDHSRPLILWSAARTLLKRKGIDNLILAIHLRADGSHQTRPTGAAHRFDAAAPWGGGGSPELRSRALRDTVRRGYWGKMMLGSTGSLPEMKHDGEWLQGGSQRRLPSSEHGWWWAVALALFRVQEVAQRLPCGLLLLLPVTDWLERWRGSGTRWRLGFDSCGSKFGEYRALFIGLLVPNHRLQRF
jgi:hypothetical protein